MGSSGFLFYFLSVDSQHVGVEDAHTYMGDSHVKNRCENRLRFFFFNKFDLFFFSFTFGHYFEGIHAACE